ncbi:hypothetical protein [Streptomyces resistomycificus]|uniref:hypothetical protein n=1 Tax=Streptomyces resistomycificus TaxID=67356 RepID=UPI0004AA1F3A|nr:hypothetical protein [Streptomyces resistomycificus]
MATTFETEVVDPANAAHGQVSLTLDPSDNPLLAYTTPSGDVMLARRGETEWQCERLPSESAAHDAYRIGLAVDSGLNEHVSYQSRATDHLIYGVRKAHETQWDLEEVPTSAGLFPDRIRFPSMRVNAGVFSEDPFKDRPHFAYQSGLQLWHATKAPPKSDPGKPATWRKNVHVVDPGNTAEAGWFPALTFDRRNETLRIAYVDDLSPTGASARRLHVGTMSPGTDFVGQEDSWHIQVLHGGQVSGELPAMEHSITGESVVSYYETQGRTLNVCIFGNFPESPAVSYTHRQRLRFRRPTEVRQAYRHRNLRHPGRGGRRRVERPEGRRRGEPPRGTHRRGNAAVRPGADVADGPLPDATWPGTVARRGNQAGPARESGAESWHRSG